MTNKLKVLDLFSGIGGFSLGLERTGGFETVAFCEIEEFPRKVLAKHWPGVRCFEDVHQLTGKDIDGTVDVICGGYPCQGESTAGKRRGKEDDRWLWPEFARLVEELRPLWVIGENVAGHVSMGLDSVLSDLEALGYTCRPFVIPACAVDAKHRRDRVWTVAYSMRTRGRLQQESGCQFKETANTEDNGTSQPLADSNDFLHARGLDAGGHTGSPSGSESGNAGEGKAHDRKRVRSESGSSGEVLADAKLVRCGQVVSPEFGGPESKGAAGSIGHCGGAEWWSRWEPEPSVGRVANGVSNRVDRLKGLGNAVVPDVPEAIGHAILASMQEAAE